MNKHLITSHLVNNININYGEEYNLTATIVFFTPRKLTHYVPPEDYIANIGRYELLKLTFNDKALFLTSQDLREQQLSTIIEKYLGVI